MIEVQQLCKSYDEVEALKEVSFSVASGEVIGLLGPNGAGKTTLMKILTGYIHPSAGQAKVAGLDLFRHPQKVQEMIGYLPENAPLYPELTVQSQLQMTAELRRIPKEKQRRYISEAVYAVDLADRLTRPIGTLSKGYRQRVGLAQAILHKPKLLILDEPTNGLDPTQIIEVRGLIKKLSQESTVFLSTHILPEVEATCDRAIIIIRGELKENAKLSELSATANAYLTLAANGVDATEIRKALEGVAGVDTVECGPHLAERLSFVVKGERGQDLCPEIFQLAKRMDWPLHELRKEVRTLESVFNELTSVRSIE